MSMDFEGRFAAFIPEEQRITSEGQSIYGSVIASDSEAVERLKEGLSRFGRVVQVPEGHGSTKSFFGPPTKYREDGWQPPDKKPNWSPAPSDNPRRN